MRSSRFLACVLGVAALLAGCGVFAPGSAAPQTATQSPTPTVVGAGTPVATPGTPPPGVEPTPEPGPMVLTVWTVEALSPSSDTPGGQALLEQLTAFDSAYPDIRVQIAPKLSSGPGSILSYLRTAPPVAPGVVPDLALMDRDGLLQAAHDNLIVPIGPLLDPSQLADLFPVAVDLGTVDQTLVGLPYVLQTQHVAYRDTLFQEPPSSFDAVLKSPVPYVFPAGTLGVVNRTTLTQYMADGGTLLDDNGAAHIDTVALTDVLSFYADARKVGVIDPALFQLTDPADSWTQYKNRQAGLAAVTSTAYLADRSELRSTGVTWTPTLTGDPYALVTGWSWVITTQDPERQAAALSLVAYLMNPANQGAFTQAAGWLPSQQGALAVWGDSDPYSAFGRDLLLHAALLPDATVRSPSGTAIQDALEAVLLNGVSPFQAASEAAQKINPPAAGSP